MTVTALHRYTLGGSDCAAAAGVHPYISRVELWAQLTGKMPRPETEAMAWGKRLEPLIVDVLTDEGYTITHAPADGFTDPERPWCIGHPDAFTVAVGGLRAVLEVKTVGQWAHHANGNGATVPLHYQCQSQWYMHLTETHRTVLAALVGGQRLEVVELERDDAAIAYLLALGESFLQLVRTNRVPEPGGSESDRAAVIALFPEAEPSKVYRLTREEWEAVRELRARREQLATVKAQAEELENRLKLAMGDAEHAISPHDTDAIRWGNVQARRIDTKALRAALPEVAGEFETVTTTRRFTLL